MNIPLKINYLLRRIGIYNLNDADALECFNRNIKAHGLKLDSAEYVIATLQMHKRYKRWISRFKQGSTIKHRYFLFIYNRYLTIFKNDDDAYTHAQNTVNKVKLFNKMDYSI